SCLLLLFPFLLFFEEGIGSSTSLVVLSDTKPETIPIILPIASEVGVAAVTMPTRVLDLIIYYAFETDPSEDPPSANHVLVAPIISPFLSSDHFEPDFEFEPSEDAYEITNSTPNLYLTCGCNRVTVKKRFRHPLPVIQPSLRLFESSSSLPGSASTADTLGSSSEISSHSSSFDTAHTPSGPLPRKRP
nr:hypothetical protein [Tanacetum cinerariifolium]